MNLMPNRQPQCAAGCAQAGVGFSFRSTLRKSSGLVNLLRIDALKGCGSGFVPL